LNIGVQTGFGLQHVGLDDEFVFDKSHHTSALAACGSNKSMEAGTSS
jgi:hypothetical protein